MNNNYFDVNLNDYGLKGIININTDDPFLFNESVSFFDTSAGLLIFNENWINYRYYWSRWILFS